MFSLNETLAYTYLNYFLTKNEAIFDSALIESLNIFTIFTSLSECALIYQCKNSYFHFL